MLDDLIDPHTKMPRDLKIDDRDHKEFPNYNEFVTSKHGLNLKPFARQLFIIANLFHEICPDCSKKEWTRLEGVPVDATVDQLSENLVYLEYGKCPSCGQTKLDFFRNGRLRAYQELAALCGQRVGKSTMFVAPAACYLLHKYLKLQRPYDVYGLNPTTLVGTLVAQTYAAAYEQLFIPMRTYLEESEWFTQYHEMLKDYGLKYGQEFFKFQPTLVHYNHRQLLVYPSGPNRKTLRGKTRFLYAIDEWDFFDADEDSEKVKMNGEEVYASLDNSLTNIRASWIDLIKAGKINTPNAYGLTASSPQYAHGVLVKHVDQHKDSKKIFTVHASTWEINPKLTRAKLAARFRSDPIKAMRDFGAVPPKSETPFIEDPAQIEKLVDPNLHNRVRYEYETIKTELSTRRAAKIIKMSPPNRVRPSLMSIDAGYNNNSFALTIGHLHPNPKSPARYVFDVMVEIAPIRKKLPLHYSVIATQLLYPLIEAFNVKAVFADRWNSLKLLHDIEHKYKIPALQYSMKYADFTTIRGYVDDAVLRIPQFEQERKLRSNPDVGKYPHCFKYAPVSHLYYQALTVQDTGRSIEKGKGLTDDIWRALCLGLRWLLDEKFTAKYLRGDMTGRARGGVAAMASATYGNMAFGGTGMQMDRSEIAQRANNVAASSSAQSATMFTFDPNRMNAIGVTSR
jgi:hypothetical protein